MIGALVAISFLAGVIAPLVTTVAFVLYFSFAAATMIAVFALVFSSGFWIAVTAWLATVVVMQLGFAISTLVLAVLRRKDRTASEGRGQRQSMAPGVASRPSVVGRKAAATVAKNGNHPAGS